MTEIAMKNCPSYEFLNDSRIFDPWILDRIFGTCLTESKDVESLAKIHDVSKRIGKMVRKNFKKMKKFDFLKIKEGVNSNEMRKFCILTNNVDKMDYIIMEDCFILSINKYENLKFGIMNGCWNSVMCMLPLILKATKWIPYKLGMSECSDYKVTALNGMELLLSSFKVSEKKWAKSMYVLAVLEVKKNEYISLYSENDEILMGKVYYTINKNDMRKLVKISQLKELEEKNQVHCISFKVPELDVDEDFIDPSFLANLYQ